MGFNDLKTFIEVAKCGSFSHAAELLFISQPAVSKRVAALEADLNARLFDRIGHKVSLTEHGRALLPRAEAIMVNIEEIRRSISSINESVSGDLMIGASHHVGLRRLPPILKTYSALYPEVNLDISFVDSEEAHDAVFRGKLELAVVTLPENAHSKLTAIPIWDDPLHIVVAKDHPLAFSGQPKLEDLAEFKAILPSQKTFTRSIVEATFEKHDIPIQIAMNTNYIETIRMMVSIGMGWSALPDTMLGEDLKILDIDDIAIHRTLGCIYHSERSLSNAARCLIKLLKEQA